MHRHRCCATAAADSCSDRTCNAAQCHIQQHSNTATQRHSDTARSLPHTAARANQRATYTQTRKHTAPQLHTPLHCTLNVLITTVGTHNGGAALHTRPRPRAAASSAATPGGTHNTSTTVTQSLSALTLQQTYTTTAARTITAPAKHWCAQCTGSRNKQQQHARRTTLTLRSRGNARTDAAHRGAQARAIRHKPSDAALRGHSAATARRGANPQTQSRGTAH
jgi:hypothetical protein